MLLVGSMAAGRHGAGEYIWELHPDLQRESWAWHGFWNPKAHPQWLASSNKATPNPLILSELYSLVIKHSDIVAYVDYSYSNQHTNSRENAYDSFIDKSSNL